MVGNPLDILVDLEAEGEHAKVVSEGLPKCHQTQALLLDGHFFFIDPVFLSAHVGGLFVIAGPECSERRLEHRNGV